MDEFRKEMTARVLGLTVDEGGTRYFNCEDGHSLAREFGYSLKEIGEFCNEDGIRIRRCQLGCF